MYRSNLFRSTEDVDYSRFPCFRARLKVDEEIAWNAFKSGKITVPHYVTGGNVYFTDWKLVEEGFFDDLALGKPKQVTISNKKVTEARIIGSMLYRAINSYLIGLDLNCAGGITARSVYYMPNDDMFVKKIQRDEEATYSVIRGFGPKIHAMAKMGQVLLFFETRHNFRIDVARDNWSKWVGFGVKVKATPSFRGIARLEKVDRKKGVATLKYGDNVFESSLDLVYVPASSGTLGKRGLYESMFEFANFNEEDPTLPSSFAFLSNIFHTILEDDSLKLRMDTQGRISCSFHRIRFEMS